MHVEVHRGGRVESRHLVDVVVVSLDSSSSAPETVVVSGDIDRPVMPRSAIKPIQAVPLVVSGAADALALGDVELALACASHNGEAAHVDAVTTWLDRIGMGVGNLECGRQRPMFEAAGDDLIARRCEPGRQHNNCSGKHTGFLSICVHLGLNPDGYINADHPVQRDHVTPSIEEFCRLSLSDQEPGVDGCGIPVWSVPLRSLAEGWARMAFVDAGRRILGAMMDSPFFVAGTGRSCTEFMSDATSLVAVKVGAEGVYCGAISPGPGESSALGVALKVHDGAQRAAPVAMAAVLERFGVLGPRQWPLYNHDRTLVGALAATGL